jgi:hypothetical protein
MLFSYMRTGWRFPKANGYARLAPFGQEAFFWETSFREPSKNFHGWHAQ